MGHAVSFFDAMPYLYMVEPNVNHTLLLSVFFVINSLSFVLASVSDPGVINRLNIDKYADLYPFDGILYKPGLSCWTCKLEKIPRSKHCGMHSKHLNAIKVHLAFLYSTVFVHVY